MQRYHITSELEIYSTSCVWSFIGDDYSSTKFPPLFSTNIIINRFGTKWCLINNDWFFTTKEVPIHKIQKYNIIISSTACITFINIPSEIPETAGKKNYTTFSRLLAPKCLHKKPVCLHYCDLFISQINFFFSAVHLLSA